MENWLAILVEVGVAGGFIIYLIRANTSWEARLDKKEEKYDAIFAAKDQKYDNKEKEHNELLKEFIQSRHDCRDALIEMKEAVKDLRTEIKNGHKR